MEQVNTFTTQLSVNYEANSKHILGKIRNQCDLCRGGSRILEGRG